MLIQREKQIHGLGNLANEGQSNVYRAHLYELIPEEAKTPRKIITPQKARSPSAMS